MSDKELIMLALLSGINTEALFDTVLSCLMNEAQAAATYGVGVPTVRAWYFTGKLKGYEIGETLLFLKNAPDPRTKG